MNEEDLKFYEAVKNKKVDAKLLTDADLDEYERLDKIYKSEQSKQSPVANDLYTKALQVGYSGLSKDEQAKIDNSDINAIPEFEIQKSQYEELKQLILAESKILKTNIVDLNKENISKNT